MSFQKDVFGIVAELTGQANILTVPRLFIELTGDLESAMFLSQLLYWTDKTKNKDGFIFKSFDDWKKELGISEYGLRKARKKFEDMGFLETEIRKANGNPTTHYKINKDIFIDYLIQFRSSVSLNTKEPKFESKESLTEITTEIKTDIKENNTSNFTNSTHSFLNEYDSNYKEEIEDSIATFYGHYQRCTGNVHPKLKEDQLQRVYEVLEGFLYEYGSLDDMIKEFFRTVKKTDYNINHFATEGMLEVLKHRVM